MRPGRRFALSAEQKCDVWRRWKAGQTLHEIGRAFGKDHNSIRGVVASHSVGDSCFYVALLPPRAACGWLGQTSQPPRPAPNRRRRTPNEIHNTCRSPGIRTTNNRSPSTGLPALSPRPVFKTKHIFRTSPLSLLLPQTFFPYTTSHTEKLCFVQKRRLFRSGT